MMTAAHEHACSLGGWQTLGFISGCDGDSWYVTHDAALPLLPQGPPGLKGEQGDTVVIDYDGRILDALKVRVFLVGPGCTLYVHF